MDRRIVLYKQIAGMFGWFSTTQAKSIQVTEDGIPVETPNHITKIDTALPYVGRHINIIIEDSGPRLITYDIPSKESDK